MTTPSWGPSLETMLKAVDLDDAQEVRERLQGSMYFEKTLRATFESLKIPEQFCREHGGHFCRDVVLRCSADILVMKKKWPVRLQVNHGRRQSLQVDVRLSRSGWIDFAAFYALAKGDHLIFSLAAKSSFNVYVFREKGASEQADATSADDTAQAAILSTLSDSSSGDEAGVSSKRMSAHEEEPS